MEAIVLAGGFGTRLSHVVSDLPKPMVPICNRPFLEYILLDLSKKGITEVVLAVGYKSDIIYNWFGESYFGVKLIYSYEDKPLFTGGAIKKALLSCANEEIFIVNGDTLFDVDLHSMYVIHKKSNAMLTIAIKEMTNFSRYGTVKFDENNHITSFEEKKYCDKGYS